jgi:copper(I)-binding protein
MRQVPSLTVQTGRSLSLAPGAHHLMLENLFSMPSVGEKVKLALHFTPAAPATVTVTVSVRPTTCQPGG